MDNWRYVTFSEPGGKYLGELDLVDVQISRVLSGGGRITAKLPSGATIPDGLAVGCCSVWAECDGQIRGGGLLDQVGVSRDFLTLEIVGFAAYPNGQLWGADAIDFYDTDPLDIVRAIWDYLQGLPGGDLGVEVDNTASAARVGRREFWLDDAGKYHPHEPDYWVEEIAEDLGVVDNDGWPIPPVKTLYRRDSPDFWMDKEGKKIPGSGQQTILSTTRTYQKSDQNKNPPTGGVWTDTRPNPLATTEYLWQRLATTFSGGLVVTHYFCGARGVRDVEPQPKIPTGWKHYTPERPPAGWTHYDRHRLPDGWAYFEPEPVSLNWWTTHNLGQVINDILGDDLDYIEWDGWAGNRIRHRLRVGQIGGRRAELRFVVGENVAAVSSGTASKYATNCLILGAGEGTAMVRAEVSRAASGVRRTVVVSDRAATNMSDCAAIGRRALADLTGLPRVTDFAIIDHPHAPLGTFDVGDEIRITGKSGLVDIDKWVKIVEMTIRPTNTEIVSISCVEI